MTNLLDDKEIIWVKEELNRICSILERNMERFGTDFPSACATNGKYRIKKNDDWTNGQECFGLLIHILKNKNLKI